MILLNEKYNKLNSNIEIDLELENRKKDGRLFLEYPLYCEGFHKPTCRGILHFVSFFFSFFFLFVCFVCLFVCENPSLTSLTHLLLLNVGVLFIITNFFFIFLSCSK